jgi:hypothetical protein
MQRLAGFFVERLKQAEIAVELFNHLPMREIVIIPLDIIKSFVEFSVASTGEDACQLVAVVQTERGPRRTEVAAVAAELWRPLAVAAVKELVNEMGEGEREKNPPTLHNGLNRLSPLVGRELGVLLIALMEEGAADRADTLLHAWRELAREERWWLYAKAAAPGQRPGAGWRRALFHALSETSDTRAAPADTAQKKSSGNTTKPSSKSPGLKVTPLSRNRPTAPPAHPHPPPPKFKATKAVANGKPKRCPKTMAR